MSSTPVRMDSLSFPLVVVCLFYNWTVTYGADCGERQVEGNEQCCDMCPPGKYLKKFCTKYNQTVCSPCEEGYFSSQYSPIDRCNRCQLCQQEYTQKCTPTTNAECSCQQGFLCSNSLCSHCVENKCSAGERLKQRQAQTEDGLIEYSYECEPECPGGVPENGIHSSYCPGPENHGSSPDWVRVILGIGFTLLSVILLLLLAFSCMTKLRRHTSCKTAATATTDNPAITAKTADFQLSQEESGISLIIQDVSKDDYVVQLKQDKVCFTNL